MAYNKPYDPDALPRFAEPEQKPGSAPPPQTYQQNRYEKKPPPPAPRDNYPPPHPQPTHSQTFHSGGGGGGGGGSGAPRPAPQPQSRPPPQQQHHPPPSPAPDATGADPTLLPLFRAVDKDGTGQLSEKELSAALVNGDWTSFDIQTVRMMIRMFDSDRNGTINFDEFCGLWSFLASWRTLFDRFDVDRSGNISLQEFTDALIAFRYRLSPQFVELLFRTYDKRNEGVMSFDLFVQSCISLKRMTDVFKKYDDDRDGFITLSFEDFLSEILKQLK
ncbi:EF-hand protein [Pochonia chlamydosporia 170]|uniref:EF-hand protein n=1 Tax=Pochonia chlamydosporia 170 TaxID=1380566 RepID=A0A179G4A0_METCM|nr:EF-hand protein [Pochonia chlamydosporia 170]OAQ72340.1 EF-hand protein [Pochonia chlamydosporia 170]